jgi:hypothetical protein
MRYVFAILFVCLLASSGFGIGVDRHVPSSYNTIQSAIDACNNGDRVMVADGTYYENIDFLGKAITVRSTSNDPESCIINGGQNGPVVIFENDEDRDSKLKGFGITNGSGMYWEEYFKARNIGGAIFGFCSSPIIENCDIYNNTLLEMWTLVHEGVWVYTSYASAIYFGVWREGNEAGVLPEGSTYPSPKITNCKIHDNLTGGQYTVFLDNAGNNTEISDSEFYQNDSSLEDSPNSGIAFYISFKGHDSSSTVFADRNRIYNNYASYSSSAYGSSPAFFFASGDQTTNIYFRNNTMAENIGYGGVKFWQGSNIYAINNTFYDKDDYYHGPQLDVFAYESNDTTTVHLYNNIFWTSLSGYGSYKLVELYYHADVDMLNNCVKNGTGEILDATTDWGDLEVSYLYEDNPYLQGPGYPWFDYHLTEESTTVIDLGTSIYAPSDDIDGDSRPSGNGYDIGSDEYIP